MPPVRIDARRQVPRCRGGNGVGSRVIGGGNEYARHHDEGDERQRMQRQRFDNPRDRRIRVAGSHEFAHRNDALQIHPHRRIADADEEDRATQRTEADHAENELLERPAARDARDEYAYIRAVGQPPRPVENAPVLHEPGFEDRIRPGIEAHELLHHQAQTVRAEFEHEVGGSGQQHEKHEKASHRSVDVAQPPDPPLQPEIHAACEKTDHHKQHHDLEDEGFGRSQQDADACGDHRGCKP